MFSGKVLTVTVFVVQFKFDCFHGLPGLCLLTRNHNGKLCQVSNVPVTVQNLVLLTDLHHHEVIKSNNRPPVQNSRVMIQVASEVSKADTCSASSWAWGLHDLTFTLDIAPRGRKYPTHKTEQKGPCQDFGV